MKRDVALFLRIYRLILRPFGFLLKKAVFRTLSGCSTLSARIYYKRSPYFAANPKRSFEELQQNKGAYGEYLLCHRLRREKGRWLFNLYLPGKEEQTEIDALFICKRGVFLFESKNFAGRIYGKEGQRDWVQSIKTERGIMKQRFFNPLMQNSAHMHALLAVLDGRTIVHPMVVFGERAKLYTPVAKERPTELCTLSRLSKRVGAFPKNALNDLEIEALYQKLLPYTVVSDYMKFEHVRRAEQKRR
jgi:hypothetical protein